MTDETQQALALLGALLAFPFAFGGFVSVLFWIFARVGGWARLASRHRAPKEAAGDLFSPGYDVSVGWIGYRGIISMRASDAGLRLEVPSFVVAHPALLVPWDALRVRPARGVFGPRLSLEVDGVTIRVDAAVSERIGRWKAVDGA